MEGAIDEPVERFNFDYSSRPQPPVSVDIGLIREDEALLGLQIHREALGGGRDEYYYVYVSICAFDRQWLRRHKSESTANRRLHFQPTIAIQTTSARVGSVGSIA